jgi:hypothetical protein
MDKTTSEQENQKPKLVEVKTCDPITRRFKKVKTRRIRKHDFYGDDGELIDETSEE